MNLRDHDKITIQNKSLILNISIIFSLVLLGSVSFAFAAVPGDPHLWKADAEDRSAKLEWNPATRDGSDNLTHYIVEYRAKGNSDWKSIRADLPFITVTGLSNGTVYEFRVMSVNDEGNSIPSNVITSQPSKYSPAGPPKNLETVSAHNAAKLRWDKPDKRYPLPFQYDVRYKTYDTSWKLDRDGDRITTSTTITGLEPGRVYEFQVRAINHAGNGAWSNSVFATIHKNTPLAPTNLTVTTIDGKVKLSWKVPQYSFDSRECSGSCKEVPNFLPPWTPHVKCTSSCHDYTYHLDDTTVTDYKIEYRTSNSGWTTYNDGKNNRTNATLTELVTGESYTIRVSATNSVGTGYPSNIVQVTVKGPPDAPEITRVEPGHNFVHVWWSKPHAGSSPITDYILQYKFGSSWITQKDGTSTTTNTKATNLKPNTLYQFRVFAVNSEGKSEPSSIMTVSTSAYGAPSEPVNLNATPGDNQVELNWDIPHKRNPPPSDYTVEYRPSDGSWTVFNDGKSTNLSTTVTGLVGGVEYEFRVFAVNSEGKSEPSSTVTAIPSPYPPSVPTNIQVKSENKKVTITWDPPTNDGGSPVTHYIVKYRTTSSWATATHVTTTDTSITITGLEYRIYFFKISAANDIGEGESSKTIPVYPFKGRHT